MKDKNYKIITFIILFFGIFLRTVLLFHNKSLYCDEIMLIENVVQGSFLDMFKPLVNTQTAPPFFLITTKFILQIFNSDNWYIRDFVPKIIPFIAGVACLPAFLKLTRTITDNKFIILSSLFLFTFNPLTINYCIIYKQYSLELLIAIILLYIFYNLLFKNKYKHWYLALIFFAPWLSFSSFFITFPLIILLFFKDKKQFLSFFSVFLISSCLFYILFLHDVLTSSYGDFDQVYQELGYLTFSHPLRLPIRLGQLFASGKLLSLAWGLVTIFLLINYLFTNNPKTKKLYYYAPIMCVLIASYMHYWALVGRLFLSFLPIFILLIVQNEYKYKYWLIKIFCICSFIFSIHYTINPIVIHPMTAATSGRDMNAFMHKQAITNEKFVTDALEQTFAYYFKDIKNTKDLVISKNCIEYALECKEKLSNLPNGRYYFIAINKINNKTILPSNTKLLQDFQYSSIYYIEK